MAGGSLDMGSIMMGLERLKMSELIERVRALGAPNDVIDECMDRDDVRRLAELIHPCRQSTLIPVSITAVSPFLDVRAAPDGVGFHVGGGGGNESSF
jgi:hypothetical protein